MLHHRTGLALLTTMILGLASLAHAATLTVTETFDSAASTAANGWVGSNNVAAGNNFGFSDTGNVSGTPGGIGGIFAGSRIFRYFADTTLNGSLSRTETLVLAGDLRLSDDDFVGAIVVGYFNAGALPTSGSGPFIGIQIWEPTVIGGAFRASAWIYDASGNTGSDVINLTQGTTYTFNLVWVGNPDGSGTLSGTIGGTPVSITAGASVDTFNAFGIASGFSTTHANKRTAPSFFDNLSYSSYPPPNEPPIANAGSDQLVHSGDVVILDGSGSSDPDGDLPLTYEWQINSIPVGSTAALNDPNAEKPSFTADKPGDYSISLVVTDARGAASAADEVLVKAEKVESGMFYVIPKRRRWSSRLFGIEAEYG
jgi:hypothetical protein